MGVNRRQLMDELELKMVNDQEAYDDFADVARMVEHHWKSLAPNPGEQYEPGRGGYATGAYKESIHRESVRGRAPKGAVNASGRRIGGQFVWHSRVVTYSPIAHFLEYGTKPDDAPNYPKPPKAGGNWFDLDGEHHFWWDTPTPRFGYAAQAAHDFGGSAP